MSPRKPHLKLYTGETCESFIEEIVGDFISSVVMPDGSLTPQESILIQQALDNFIEYCAVHASDKIVLGDGKMTPLASSR